MESASAINEQSYPWAMIDRAISNEAAASEQLKEMQNTISS
jgi:hypothetical protein